MTDRIEKKILLRAPRARVWRALADAEEFGQWFGVKFDGPFTPGAVQRGVIVPTTVDADVAKAQQPYAGMPFEITIDRIEPSGSSPSDGIPSPSSAVSTTRASRRPSSSSRLKTSRTARC